MTSYASFCKFLKEKKCMFNTVILYHYTINNDYARYYILSARFLDIRISTYFVL